MKYKTMISMHHPQIIKLNHELSLVSKETCVLWCLDIIETMLIPCILRQGYPIESSLATVSKVKLWINKEIKLTQVKPLILKLHEQARMNSDHIIVMGCLRAVAHGCSTIHSQRHAIEIAYYGALALAKEQCQQDSSLEIEHEVTRIIHMMHKRLISIIEEWSLTRIH
jgi:hypothetical protein